MHSRRDLTIALSVWLTFASFGVSSETTVELDGRAILPMNDAHLQMNIGILSQPAVLSMIEAPSGRVP